MNNNWFRKVGIIYVPARFPAYFILLLFMGYAVYLFIDIDKRSHSVSDTLINFVFNLGILFVIYTMIVFMIRKFVII